MNKQDDRQQAILSQLGFQIVGSTDLTLLANSVLPDDQLIEAMRRLALSLDPIVDLAGHAISEEEWLRRRGRRLARKVDPDRRRRRKAAKRRHRPR